MRNSALPFHRGSVYNSLQHLKNLRKLSLSFSAICYCTDFRNFVQFIPHVIDLTITRAKTIFYYRIPAEVFLKSVVALDQLEHLRSLSIVGLNNVEQPVFSIIRERLTRLRKLRMKGCRILILDKEILDYIAASQELRELQFCSTRVHCNDFDDFVARAGIIVARRENRLRMELLMDEHKWFLPGVK